MLHFDESIQMIQDLEIKNYKIKHLPLMEAQGYVLAADIVADHNSPLNSLLLPWMAMRLSMKIWHWVG